ncbi:MAG: hypothetical protein ACNI27_00125 [Desulfovibrio sp.]
MHSLKWILFFLVILSTNAYAGNSTVFTLRGPETDFDIRQEYDNALFRLALEKTRPEWGDYSIFVIPKMNLKRAFRSLENNTYTNLFFKTSADNDLCAQYGFVNFPVDLGIVGYRVAFTSPAVNEKTRVISQKDELLKLTLGQALMWEDTLILREAGFTVFETELYKPLFEMVAKNRFDLFPRGINEIKAEYESHSHLNNFMIEENIAIHYPLPRFFYTSRSNTKNIERITQGLKLAFSDGSLLKLWKEYYQESVDLVNLNSRRFFCFKNPRINTIDTSYEKYFMAITPQHKRCSD